MSLGNTETETKSEPGSEVSLNPRAGEVAAIISSMEMGAALGTYEKVFEIPQIDELREKLTGDEVANFERLMEVYEQARGHSLLRNVSSNIVPFLYPKEQVGDECPQTLYLLAIGASVHKESHVRDAVRESYIKQCGALAVELGKDSSELTFLDFGHGILTGSFNPQPEIPELS